MMADLLAYYEHPQSDFPYNLALINRHDGEYVVEMFSLDAYISCQKLVGLYRENDDTRYSSYSFTDKADAMMIKLGWDPSQDKWETVSGPGW